MHVIYQDRVEVTGKQWILEISWCRLAAHCAKLDVFALFMAIFCCHLTLWSSQTYFLGGLLSRYSIKPTVFLINLSLFFHLVRVYMQPVAPPACLLLNSLETRPGCVDCTYICLPSISTAVPLAVCSRYITSLSLMPPNVVPGPAS